MNNFVYSEIQPCKRKKRKFGFILGISLACVCSVMIATVLIVLYMLFFRTPSSDIQFKGVRNIRVYTDAPYLDLHDNFTVLADVMIKITVNNRNYYDIDVQRIEGNVILNNQPIGVIKLNHTISFPARLSTTLELALTFSSVALQYQNYKHIVDQCSVKRSRSISVAINGFYYGYIAVLGRGRSLQFTENAALSCNYALWDGSLPSVDVSYISIKNIKVRGRNKYNAIVSMNVTVDNTYMLNLSVNHLVIPVFHVQSGAITQRLGVLTYNPSLVFLRQQVTSHVVDFSFVSESLSQADIRDLYSHCVKVGLNVELQAHFNTTIEGFDGEYPFSLTVTKIIHCPSSKQVINEILQ